MQNKILNIGTLMLITALIFAMAFVSSADNTTPKEVEKKVAEAAEAIKNLSVDERDEAVQKAKEILDDLDTRIDQLGSQLNDQWDRLDRTARKKMTDSLTALRKQRNDVAEWYGGLKHSSGNAWEDVKKGFLNSYQRLRNSFEKARRDF